jgi:hypothetical protein
MALFLIKGRNSLIAKILPINFKILIMSFLKEFMLFLKERKKFWLIPLIIILLFMGLIVLVGGGSALAPFIYSLF